jgi:hypothetical protein
VTSGEVGGIYSTTFLLAAGRVKKDETFMPRRGYSYNKWQARA